MNDSRSDRTLRWPGYRIVAAGICIAGLLAGCAQSPEQVVRPRDASIVETMPAPRSLVTVAEIATSSSTELAAEVAKLGGLPATAEESRIRQALEIVASAAADLAYSIELRDKYSLAVLSDGADGEGSRFVVEWNALLVRITEDAHMSALSTSLDYPSKFADLAAVNADVASFEATLRDIAPLLARPIATSSQR